MLKMAKNGHLEAEMGPKEAKTAQNGPKCPQNDPKPKKKDPLRKAPRSPCVWTPNSRVAPVGDHTIAKNGQKWAPWRPRWVKKRPKQPNIGANAPKMTPNLGKRLRYIKPPYHHVFAPPTPGWQRSAATLQLKNGQKWPPGGQNGPKRGQQQQATSRWASFDISGTPIA